MNVMPLTPPLSPQTGRGRREPFALRERGEGGARVSGRVRGRCDQSVGAVIFLAFVLSLALAGCGKRNAPQPPPDVPNTYPRPYPSE